MPALTPYLSLQQLQTSLANGDFTSAELVQFYLDRIHQYDPDLHAYVTVFADKALAAANKLDGLRAQGSLASPLHGIPLAVKDLFEFEGTLCTASSQVFADRISTTTAPALLKLLHAGSIFLGKLQMVEFAFGGYGTNLHFGPPKNPWKKTVHYTPGGSSSGSAVAVAAGLAPAALGTDTGGSVRIPAALNGIIGLKPTQDRISLQSCIPLSPTHDSVGPMTLTVDDAILLYEYMSQDMIQVGDAKQLRIAYLDPASLAVEIAPDVLQALENTKQALIDAGAQVKTVSLDFSWTGLSKLSGDIKAAEAYAWHKEWIDTCPEKYNPVTLKRLLQGEHITTERYQALLQERNQHIAMFETLMQTWDVLLLPTVPITAIPIDDVIESANSFAPLTRSVNYLNGCAITIPVGLDRQGLPIGAQVVSSAHQESKIITLAKLIEQVIPFHHHPDE